METSTGPCLPPQRKESAGTPPGLSKERSACLQARIVALRASRLAAQPCRYRRRRFLLLSGNLHFSTVTLDSPTSNVGPD
jgi:hypothetical protein